MAWDDEEPYYPRQVRARPTAFYLPPEPSRPPRTSRTEMIDLTVAVLVLTIIFAGAGLLDLISLPPGTIAILLVASFVAVLTSVVVHELAHKFVAQRYGCWAEFRKSTTWLMIGLFASLSGFPMIAAPGAVMIFGRVNVEENGKISAAGPLSNAIMGFIFLPLAMSVPTTSIVGFMLLKIVVINGMLGAFNMIPMNPIDGSKIIKWSIGAYVGVLAANIGVIVLAQMRFNFLGLP